MRKKIAVIDLGTNTFHLIVAAPEENKVGFEIVYRERQFVKLAEDGIEKIGEAPFNRGIQTLIKFRNVLDRYGVDIVGAVGTAALRTATNGKQFVKEAEEKAMIPIQLIDGQREAELIGKGVAKAIPDFGLAKYLIMDIGGGSVEFILANHSQVFWARSFPIGVAVLFRSFHHSDPIQTNEVESIEQFLEEPIQILKEALSKHEISLLVGASGTFDVLENLLAERDNGSYYSNFQADKFWPIYEKLLYSTLEERFQNPSIPKARAEMLIASMILISKVLKLINVPRIVVSSFALKEGLLGELINQKGDAVSN